MKFNCLDDWAKDRLGFDAPDSNDPTAGMPEPKGWRIPFDELPKWARDLYEGEKFSGSQFKDLKKGTFVRSWTRLFCQKCRKEWLSDTYTAVVRYDNKWYGQPVLTVHREQIPSDRVSVVKCPFCGDIGFKLIQGLEKTRRGFEAPIVRDTSDVVDTLAIPYAELPLWAKKKFAEKRHRPVPRPIPKYYIRKWQHELCRVCLKEWLNEVFCSFTDSDDCEKRAQVYYTVGSSGYTTKTKCPFCGNETLADPVEDDVKRRGFDAPTDVGKAPLKPTDGICKDCLVDECDHDCDDKIKERLSKRELVEWKDVPSWAMDRIPIQKQYKEEHLYEKRWVKAHCSGCDKTWLVGQWWALSKTCLSAGIGQIISRVCPFCGSASVITSFGVTERVGFEAPRKQFIYADLPAWARKRVKTWFQMPYVEQLLDGVPIGYRDHLLYDAFPDELKFEKFWFKTYCNLCNKTWMMETYNTLWTPTKDERHHQGTMLLCRLFRDARLEDGVHSYHCPFCGNTNINIQAELSDRKGFDAPRARKGGWNVVPGWAKELFRKSYLGFTEEEFSGFYYAHDWIERTCGKCDKTWLSDVWLMYFDKKRWVSDGYAEKGDDLRTDTYLQCPLCGDQKTPKALGKTDVVRQGFDAPEKDWKADLKVDDFVVVSIHSGYEVMRIIRLVGGKGFEVVGRPWFKYSPVYTIPNEAVLGPAHYKKWAELEEPHRSLLTEFHKGYPASYMEQLSFVWGIWFLAECGDCRFRGLMNYYHVIKDNDTIGGIHFGCPRCLSNNFNAVMEGPGRGPVQVPFRQGFDAPDRESVCYHRKEDLPRWAKELLETIGFDARRVDSKHIDEYQTRFDSMKCHGCGKVFLRRTLIGKDRTGRQNELYDAYKCPFCEGMIFYTGAGVHRRGFEAPEERVTGQDLPLWARKALKEKGKDIDDYYFVKIWVERVCAHCGRMWLSEVWKRFLERDNRLAIDHIERGESPCPFCGRDINQLGQVGVSRRGFEAEGSNER